MKRPAGHKGLKRPAAAAAAECEPVLEVPAALSAGTEAAPGAVPAEAGPRDPPQFDHHGCSKCKKKPHGCTRCKTFANDNHSGYFWLGSQVVFFLARSCLGQVPGGAPFSQRSELATACTNRMQIKN